MKFSIITGTAGCGKTSVIVNVCEYLKQLGQKPVVAKIDCIATTDDQNYKSHGIPSIKGLSKDLCPDHFTTYNLDEIFKWSHEQNASVLIIETAGYCLRCAPYIKDCLGIFVADVTQGIAMPLKVGPMLSLADSVVITKGDVLSQAEREVFSQRISEVNPRAIITEVNGLTGYGCREVAELINNSDEVETVTDHELREKAPFAVCTLCTGEKRVGQKYHRGLLRSLDGIQEYKGE